MSYSFLSIDAAMQRDLIVGVQKRRPVVPMSYVKVWNYIVRLSRRVRPVVAIVVRRPSVRRVGRSVIRPLSFVSRRRRCRPLLVRPSVRPYVRPVRP